MIQVEIVKELDNNHLLIRDSKNNEIRVHKSNVRDVQEHS